MSRLRRSFSTLGLSLALVLVHRYDCHRSGERAGTGHSGAGRTRPAWRGRPIRPPSGARRRTSAGRSRSRAAARRRRSCGAIASSADRRAGRGSPADAHSRGGMVTPRVPHQFVVLAIDRRTASRVGADRARGAPHEASHQDNGTWASSSAVTDGEHVIASFESQGLYAYDMNGTLGLGRRTSATRGCATSSARARRRRSTATRSWSSGITSCRRVVHRRARQGDGHRAVARQARRDRHLGDAARRRARRPRAGDRAGMNRLRSYDLETGEVVWETAGPDDESDSVAGLRRRDGVRDQRLPRQQPEGDRLADAKGDITGRRTRVVARSRHAVRAVAAPVRRHPLHPEDQQRTAVGVRREDRQAALPGAAARRRPTSSPRRSAPPGASTSPGGRARPWCSSRARRSR